MSTRRCRAHVRRHPDAERKRSRRGAGDRARCDRPPAPPQLGLDAPSPRPARDPVRRRRDRRDRSQRAVAGRGHRDPVAGGGRVDLAFTMPRTPARASPGSARRSGSPSTEASVGCSSPPTRSSTRSRTASRRRRRSTRRAPSTAAVRLHDHEEARVPRRRPGLQWAINGGIHPDVPVFVVEQGDLVEITITNDTKGIHPMHLHGHHVLVLSRDGVPVSGSPWWSDTLDVLPESATWSASAPTTRAWMDHCHNLRHAADGLTMHVAYAGVTHRSSWVALTTTRPNSRCGLRRGGRRADGLPPLPLVPRDPAESAGSGTR